MRGCLTSQVLHTATVHAYHCDHQIIIGCCCDNSFVRGCCGCRGEVCILPLPCQFRKRGAGVGGALTHRNASLSALLYLISRASDAPIRSLAPRRHLCTGFSLQLPPLAPLPLAPCLSTKHRRVHDNWITQYAAAYMITG